MLIGVVFVVVVLLAIAGFCLKNSQQKKREEEERIRKIEEEKERQRQIALEQEAKKAARKAEIEAGKELYHYLNQSIKTMFYHYRTDKWDELESLGQIDLQDKQAARRCINKLSDSSKTLVDDFISCLDYDDTFEGQGLVKDSQKLRTVFENVMLPFFPIYYKEFSAGPRYISFLNQPILKVFTQLSGKKFRLGYKNRYQNGQIAFEWSDEVYRVFRADGTKLCEASFEDGKVKEGYAIIKSEEKSEELWDVFQKGQWVDGQLCSEDLQYKYKIAIL